MLLICLMTASVCFVLPNTFSTLSQPTPSLHAIAFRVWKSGLNPIDVGLMKWFLRSIPRVTILKFSCCVVLVWFSGRCYLRLGNIYGYLPRLWLISDTDTECCHILQFVSFDHDAVNSQFKVVDKMSEYGQQNDRLNRNACSSLSRTCLESFSCLPVIPIIFP